ncbi:hypothetical protein SAMN06295879_0681 [Agreia bicolorata]|uniref:PH domain-containing protein n=1 Tax=Agreia bicolorata TaxID=110935 RepID=A0A1T4X800_9MICO|nr:hypothetical protein [Agreia bicolorata]SKA84971.1 hypothetical protein SAMN06295879_0681 [Agreia bicolorata]
MDRILPGSIILLGVVGLLILMVLGWRARGRRQSALSTAAVPPDELLGELRIAVTGLYVSTTTAGAPLDRVTLRGLGFRGRATVSVFDAGILISVTGEPQIFVATERVRSVGTSTWTIDRAVEEGGLVRLDWTLESESSTPAADVESFFRIENPDQSSRLIEAITALTPSPGPANPDQEGSLA